MEKNSYQIIDNFLTPTYHQQLLNLVDSDVFQWQLKKNISSPSTYSNNDDLDGYGFFHMLDNSSKWADLFKPLLYQIMDKVGAKQILRARADMVMYSHKPKTHEPHVDHAHMGHWSAVYYLNDSDGDTILYDELYEEKYDKPEYILKPENFTEITRVTPKANKVFIFNGLNMHTGQSPTKHKNRMIINCNFI